MTANTGIGGNNPPEDQRIQMLVPASDITVIIGETVKELSEKAEAILATYSRVPDKIENEETYDKVVSLIAAIRTIDADRETRRKEKKDPYHKAGKAVDDAFKLPDEKGEDRSKKMEAAIKNLTSRLSAFDTIKYQAEQAAAKKEAEDLAARASEDGITINTDNIEIKMEGRKSQHGGSASKNILKEWEVVDEAAVPRSLLSVDPKKVQALVDKGAEIPGIKITERVNTVVKRS